MFTRSQITKTLGLPSPASVCFLPRYLVYLKFEKLHSALNLSSYISHREGGNLEPQDDGKILGGVC